LHLIWIQLFSVFRLTISFHMLFEVVVVFFTT
jgi:hypothetical protein